MLKKAPPVFEYAAIWRTLAGAFIISFSSVYVKLAHVAPPVSAFYRVFIGAISLTVATAVFGQFKWPGAKNVLLLLAAGIFFSLDLFAWHRSIMYVGPGLATILANFQIFLLTEPISKRIKRPHIIRHKFARKLIYHID